MRSSTRALAVPQLQPSKVRVGLVGEEDLEAMAVVVAESQLAPGWASPPADRPGPFRPGVQGVDEAGQLADLGAIADLAVGVDRTGPGGLG